MRQDYMKPQVRVFQFIQKAALDTAQMTPAALY